MIFEVFDAPYETSGLWLRRLFRYDTQWHDKQDPEPDDVLRFGIAQGYINKPGRYQVVVHSQVCLDKVEIRYFDVNHVLAVAGDTFG
jgi:hypothetical protein